MLDTAETQYAALQSRGRLFDKDLTADMTKAGGEHYAALVNLAYRQTLAAHGLVADLNGEPMLFSQGEFFPTVAIATVDVLYPSAPFFLFLPAETPRSPVAPCA